MKKRFLIPIITLIIVGAAITTCFIMTNPMQKESKEVTFTVEKGATTRSILKDLKKAGLIRNEYFTLAYIRINKLTKFHHGYFELDKDMSLKELLSVLNDPTEAKDIDSKIIRFDEGSNLEDFASKIAKSYGLDASEVVAKMDDATFVKSLVDDTSLEIVTNSVFNQGIRHHLEGYLYADTYYFSKDASVEDITRKLVSTMNEKYKQAAKESGWSGTYYHDVLTLASVVELEGPSRNSENYTEELQGIAEVFLNRKNAGMTLGSDVTTYYSVRKKIGVDSLYMSDFNVCDGYNTRGKCVKWLPVGAIASPSYDSILAVLNGLLKPKYKEYYYFVADKNTKIYFSKTSDDQTKVIQELRSKGLWLED